MLLPRASEMTSHYEYKLPPTITQEDGRLHRYQLQLYKQAGAPDQQVQVEVTLPASARTVSVHPEPSAQDADTIYFTIELDSDQLITVTYD
jgi:hypothetical protein